MKIFNTRKFNFFNYAKKYEIFRLGYKQYKPLFYVGRFVICTSTDF